MDQVIRPLDIRWTVFISGALHAGIFLLLALRISNVSVVPVGVEVQYREASASASASRNVSPVMKPVVRTRAALKEPGPALVKEARQEQAASAIPASAGPLGQKDGASVAAVERYKYELRLFLESRKIYPETAKRLHQTGTVVVQFKVSSAGQLLDVILEQASNSEVLNRAALELVKRASQFKPFPSEVQLTELRLSLPIEYIL